MLQNFLIPRAFVLIAVLQAFLVSTQAFADEYLPTSSFVRILKIETPLGSCKQTPLNARDVFLRYPIILTVDISSEGLVKIVEVYKGNTIAEAAFTAEAIKRKSINAQGRALIIADVGTAGNIRCADTFFEKQAAPLLNYYSILAEAAPYAAQITTRMNDIKGIELLSPDPVTKLTFSRKYGELQRSMRRVALVMLENQDYLGLIDLGFLTLQKFSSEKNFSRRNSASRIEKCEGHTQYNFFNEQGWAQLIKGRPDGYHSHGSMAYMSKGLMALGYYEDALASICATGDYNSYQQALFLRGN